MANSQKQPTIERGPARRAQGLDEEVTAQPRPLADELDLEAASEPELSVDPEDLGARFLSDAIEQGDFSPAQRFPADSSLTDVPARDQALSGPNFVAGNSVWEQTVDLEMRTRGASDQLREPSAETTDDAFDAALADADETDSDTRSERRVGAAEGMPELSLLDREGEEADETIAPNIDLDEQGSHTRFASGMSPEPKLEDDTENENEPRITGMRPKAPLKAAARSMLDRGAGLLRRVADRLERYGT